MYRPPIVRFLGLTFGGRYMGNSFFFLINKNGLYQDDQLSSTGDKLVIVMVPPLRFAIRSSSISKSASVLMV